MGENDTSILHMMTARIIWDNIYEKSGHHQKMTDSELILSVSIFRDTSQL